MKFKEVEISSVNPFKSDEERNEFAKLFSHFCDYATRVTKSGDVLEEDEIEAHTFFTPAYFLGWKWYFDIALNALKGRGYPEREFVDFVFDMSTRLGIVPYDSTSEKSMTDFENEACGRYESGKLTKHRKEGGGYKNAVIDFAYDAWCKARTQPRLPIRKVEQG